MDDMSTKQMQDAGLVGKSEEFTYCLFCGESFPVSTDPNGPGDVVAHIEKCPNHPLFIEKQRRVYYQDIVYTVCNVIDRWKRHNLVGVACGTASEPSHEVQDKIADMGRENRIFRDLLLEVLDSGVSFVDERIRYKEVQLSCALLRDIKRELEGK